MSDKIIMDHLRKSLVPQGSANVVRLQHASSIKGVFYEADFITRALADMDRTLFQASALGEPITALQRIAIDLLMDSAGLSTVEDIKNMIQWNEKHSQ